MTHDRPFRITKNTGSRNRKVKDCGETGWKEGGILHDEGKGKRARRSCVAGLRGLPRPVESTSQKKKLGERNPTFRAGKRGGQCETKGLKPTGGGVGGGGGGGGGGVGLGVLWGDKPMNPSFKK